MVKLIKMIDARIIILLVIPFALYGARGSIGYVKDFTWWSDRGVFIEKEPNDTVDNNYGHDYDYTNTYWWWESIKGYKVDTYSPRDPSSVDPYRIKVVGTQDYNGDIDQYKFYDLNETGVVKMTVVKGSWEYCKLERVYETWVSDSSGGSSVVEWEQEKMVLPQDSSELSYSISIPRQNWQNPLGSRKFSIKPLGDYELLFEYITDSSQTDNTDSSFNSGWTWNSWPWSYSHNDKDWLYYHVDENYWYVWRKKTGQWHKWDPENGSWY